MYDILKNKENYLNLKIKIPRKKKGHLTQERKNITHTHTQTKGKCLKSTSGPHMHTQACTPTQLHTSHTHTHITFPLGKILLSPSGSLQLIAEGLTPARCWRSLFTVFTAAL